MRQEQCLEIRLVVAQATRLFRPATRRTAGATIQANGDGLFATLLAAVPVGGSPTGAGGSSAPPIFKTGSKACQRSGLQWAATNGDRHSLRCRTGDVFFKDGVVLEFCRMRLRQPQIAGLKALSSARVNQSRTWHRSCQTPKSVMTNSNVLLMKTKLSSHSKYLRKLYIASLS